MFKSIWHPRKKVPPVVDLEQGFSAIEDQGDIGSCVANAAVALLEFLELKKTEPFLDLCRLMVYYNARDLEGTSNEDAGCQIRDAIKALAKLGTCLESTWPYDVSKFAVKPPPEAFTEGLKHLAGEYRSVNTGNELQACLAEGYPVQFGIVLYESFMTDAVKATGIVPMPKPRKESQVGGHSMVIAGYDLKKKLYKIRNSWGVEFGQRGYCFMPMAYVDSQALDLWTIRRVG